MSSGDSALLVRDHAGQRGLVDQVAGQSGGVMGKRSMIAARRRSD